MGNEPFFPPPRKKDGAYREPAPRPPADPTPDVKRVVVVSRPEAPPPSYAQPKDAVPARELLVPTADERTYWERHTTFARFPRPIGGAMVLLGGWIVWEAFHTLLHGGYYGVKGTLFGPVAVLTGFWALLFGYPIERNGRPPSWWTFGQIACVIVGLCLGAALLAVLAGSAAY